MNFREVDRRYADLKQQHDNGDLSAEAFDEQLEQMMVQDNVGRWWAKSRETGDWHYYDGSTWVLDTPPDYEIRTVRGRPPVQEPPPVQPPPVQPSPVQLPPVQPIHQNGGQQRRGGHHRGMIVGALSVVAALIIFVVVVASLGSSGDSVDFTIRDNLAPEQAAEEVIILIDGKNVGTLTVDQNNRTDELDVSVDGPGRYSYTASANAIFQDQAGQFEASGTGQGTIEIRDGKVFEVQGSVSGNTWQITLVEQ